MLSISGHLPYLLLYYKATPRVLSIAMQPLEGTQLSAARIRGVVEMQSQQEAVLAGVLPREVGVHRGVPVVVHAGLLRQAFWDLQIGGDLGREDVACTDNL